jgi:hypothetical protein
MKAAFLTMIALFLVGCSGLGEGVLYWHDYPKSQYRKLNMKKIRLGMTKEEVRDALGEPAGVIGSVRDETGHLVEVIQYLEAEFSYVGSHDRLKKDFYLYFVDDELVQWGRPGDWRGEAKYIIEHRYKFQMEERRPAEPRPKPQKPLHKI